jgi:hypothetical protein
MRSRVGRVKCASCLRPINRGAEEAKRAEAHLVDGVVVVFGVNMPGGPLEKATGELLWAKHSKCYWIDEKREKRQEAKQEERAADPGYRPRPDSDWRSQQVADVEELLGGTDRTGREPGGADGVRHPG